MYINFILALTARFTYMLPSFCFSCQQPAIYFFYQTNLQGVQLTNVLTAIFSVPSCHLDPLKPKDPGQPPVLQYHLPLIVP